MLKQILLFFLILVFVNPAHAMDIEDKNAINQILEEYADYPGGLDALAKNFEITTTNFMGGYRLNFVLKAPPRVSYELTLETANSGHGLSFYALPDTALCSTETLNILNEVMLKEKVLHMLVSGEDPEKTYQHIYSFDLSKGYLGLLQQDLIYYLERKNILQVTSRCHDGFAVVYYFDHSLGVYDPFSNLFCVWIDVDKKVISGANWVTFPMGSAHRLTSKEFENIDNRLNHMTKSDFDIIFKDKE